MISEAISKAVVINRLKVKATVAELGLDGLQSSFNGHSERIRKMAEDKLVVPFNRSEKAMFEKAVEKRINSLINEVNFLNKCLQATSPILEEYAKTREINLMIDERIN